MRGCSYFRWTRSRSERPGQPNLDARIASYELAGRMQLAAIDALDISGESAATREMYGLNDKRCSHFARQCLMARRLVERGVRFVQIFSGGMENERSWDGHIDIAGNHRQFAGETDVPTLGGKAQLKVPAGTQSGQMFKLRGKGITNVNGRGHGDLFARLIVEVPSRLNPEQRSKLQEFAALCGDENTPMRRSFFDRAKEFFK